MINLTDYIRSVQLEITPSTKEQVIREMLFKSYDNLDSERKKELYELLLLREEQGTTSIGNGIAVPHTSAITVSNTEISLAVFKKGVNFDSIDGKPVHLVFLIVGPPSEEVLHLQILAKIARLFKHKELAEQMLNCQEEKTVVDCLKKYEKTYS